MKRKTNVFSGSVAFVIAADKFSVIAAAVLAHKERIIGNANFFNDVYIVEPNEAIKLDVSDHDHVYVIGLNPENMGSKSNFNNFFFRHQKQLRFWYSRKILPIESVSLLQSAGVSVFANPNFMLFAKRENGSIIFETIDLINTYTALENSKSKGFRTALSETFRKSLYVAKIYDRLEKKKKFVTNKLFAELFKICIGEQSSTVFNMVMDYRGDEFYEIQKLLNGYEEIKDNHYESEEKKVKHPILGLMSIVKPENDLVDRKKFFQKLGDYDAVAVAALDQDPEGHIFEVCISHKKTKAMTEENWKQIPFIKRINGHRFLIQEEFVTHLQKELL